MIKKNKVIIILTRLQTSWNNERSFAYLWISGGMVTGGTTEDDITGDELVTEGSTVNIEENFE